MKLSINGRKDRIIEVDEFLLKESISLNTSNYLLVGYKIAENRLQEQSRKMLHVGRTGPVVGSKSFRDRKLHVVQTAFRDINLYSRVKGIDLPLGYIYAVSNPNFPGYLKIGSAKDAESRLNSYQTYSPFRDFKLEFYMLTENFRLVEKELHALLDCKGEWTSKPRKEVKEIIISRGLV